MKIGMITYHRAENYGSALQAFALTYALKKMGHEPYVIDFSTQGQRDLYRLYENNGSALDPIRNLQRFFYKKKLIERKKRFAGFIKENVPLTECKDDWAKDLNNSFDMFICGSDQIWNTNCADFAPAYMLDFVSDKSKCVSYAASIGKAGMDDKEKELIKSYVGRFKNISVRESSLARELEKVIEQKADVVPDPVLLMNREEWDKIGTGKPKYDHYILGYFIGDVPRMRAFAYTMHKKTHLPLVLLNINLRDAILPGKKMYNAGPVDFVELIRNADYVCTNSYHALLFSAIYRKNYWVFASPEKGNANSRLLDISERFGLTDRMIGGSDELPKDVEKPVDYTDVEEKVKEYANYGRERLQEYLR